ncbi:MAG TPA: hypothetical protein VMV09_08715 [Candidatus Saccharimonadales bacterium]|nr:hypothetical protein [Candidatus Saccharimonadales bacterium]
MQVAHASAMSGIFTDTAIYASCHGHIEPQLAARLFVGAKGVAPRMDGLGLTGSPWVVAATATSPRPWGCPPLDGVGIVGGHAHAEREWALTDSLPDWAALVVGCIAGICGRRLT